MKIGIYIIGLFLLATSDLVNAGEWIGLVSGGQATNAMPRDGTYWQKGLDHQSDMRDFTYSVGLGYKTNRILYLAAYDNLGRHSVDSMAYSDNEYNPMVKGGCWLESCDARDPALFRTKEKIDGLRLAIATPGKGPYGEIGLYLYKSDIRMDVAYSNGRTVKIDGKQDLQHGFEVAGGWVFENGAFVKARYYDLGGSSGLPVMSEAAWTVNIGMEF